MLRGAFWMKSPRRSPSAFTTCRPSPIPTGAANVTRIVKPADAPPQPWNNRMKGADEKQGKELIVESVGLSPSQRVGASKRGNRNIIPITGGDLSGRITGKVLSGGADYQNLSGPPAIDARYLWQASDGEIIIVRNTTSAPAAWFRFSKHASTAPTPISTPAFPEFESRLANGGVKITMYDSTNYGALTCTPSCRRASRLPDTGRNSHPGTSWIRSSRPLTASSASTPRPVQNHRRSAGCRCRHG